MKAKGCEFGQGTGFDPWCQQSTVLKHPFALCESAFCFEAHRQDILSLLALCPIHRKEFFYAGCK
jgi:hypothetical protein